MYVCMYICMNVRMYKCMYECIYVSFFCMYVLHAFNVIHALHFLLSVHYSVGMKRCIPDRISDETYMKNSPGSKSRGSVSSVGGVKSAYANFTLF